MVRGPYEMHVDQNLQYSKREQKRGADQIVLLK